jgi:predicted ATPase/DNA-binding CsgD family transcriptional regulator
MNSPAASGGSVAGRRRWQLPADVSGFIGRSDELARLSGLLAASRLVTVAGPGGVGKTRLALRAAAETAAAGGSCLVELSGLTDPLLLADTIALRLGVPRADTACGIESLLRDLRARKLLLILDTCEHLTAACAALAAAVLHETADITILATSRQPLHVSGEEVLRLGPLPVPAADAVLTRNAALAGSSAPAEGHRTTAGDAVDLFAQRAAAAVSGFTLSAADLPHAIRLCRRLDGIPLAIELAAVRVRALPIPELAARLDAGFAAATGTRRGTVSRHQTLHAAIDWSYGLCTPAEQAAWRRLAVFAGTFDPAVARDVIAGADLPPEQVREVLAGLVDKSVVLQESAGRYRLLDTVREYGARRLADAGEGADYRQRHLSRYLDLSREFSHRLIADGQRERLSQLRAEHVNIRRALEYGLSGGDRQGGDGVPERARGAARLAAALFPYWTMSGSFREGIHWQDRVLARFREASAERASALANRALLATAAGAAEAVDDADEAIAMAARLGDERTHARAYLARQFALTTAGRYQEALDVAKQARWRLEALGAEHALRTLDMQLALTYVHSRNPEAALEHSQRLLNALCPGERWLRGNAYALSALAYYLQPGRRSECASAAGSALRATLEIGNLVGVGYSLEVFAWLAADAGRCQRAGWLLGAAQAVWERTGGRLSGSAVLEGYHKRAAGIAEGVLGTAKYTELHAAGATRPQAQIAALALAGADVLPGSPAQQRDGEPGDWLGGEVLTSRERQIAELVARGLSNREIAERLVISKRTVDAHVNHIFGKLGLSSRVQLTIWLRGRTQAPAADELSATVRT